MNSSAANFAFGTIGLTLIVWYVLQAIADWKILSKAGKPGWHSLIPILNVYSEYDICWTGGIGVVYTVLMAVANTMSKIENASMGVLGVAAVLGVVGFVIHVMQSLRLAKSYGKGTGYGVFLILLGPIARIILGFGSSEYVGKP